MLPLFLLICLVNLLYSQKEFDKWVFGKGAGLDFTSGSAVVMNTTSNGWDNSASIADSAGNLLFASDGQWIYDRAGNVMPNGSGIMGDTSGGATATIVRKPGSENLYYVFTDPGYTNVQGFRYTVVNMNLNGGLGDVDTANKNVLVFTPFTEKIVPIVHANGQDVWILVHEWNSDVYRAYLLTDTGLQTNYVASPVGSVISGSQDNALGQLTVNSAGNMIACAILNAGLIDISNFDNSTGVVNNTITVTDISTVIGLEFSPDGSKLYASHLNSQNLMQYDVSSFNQQAITNSGTAVGTIPATYSTYAGGYLMLGPDGKIYVTVTFSHNVGVIDSPNLSGTACHYNGTEIDLGQHTVIAGLVDKIAVTHIKSATTVSNINANIDVTSKAFPNPFNGYTNITVSGLQKPYDFELVDLTGSVKRAIPSITDNHFQLINDGLAPGMYLYRIVVDGKPVAFSKLVIQ